MRRSIKSPGKCIFCGRVAGTKQDGISVKMSKQHLWPVWLQRYFPRKSLEHTVFRQSVKYHNQAFYVSPYIFQNQGDVKSTKIKVICERHCNNCWISTLENSTKKFPESILLAKKHTLSGEEQSSLALWLSVLTVCGEYTDLLTNDDDALHIADRIFRISNDALAMTCW